MSVGVGVSVLVPVAVGWGEAVAVPVGDVVRERVAVGVWLTVTVSVVVYVRLLVRLPGSASNPLAWPHLIRPGFVSRPPTHSAQHGACPPPKNGSLKAFSDAARQNPYRNAIRKISIHPNPHTNTYTNTHGELS